jgi:hypothetical protein
MGEEWATLSTTVRYGRRRPAWPLDHHILDRPGKTLDDQRCALTPIELSSGHGRVLTHRLSLCARRPWIGTSSSPPLDIFDCIQVVDRFCAWVCVLRSRGLHRGV